MWGRIDGVHRPLPGRQIRHRPRRRLRDRPGVRSGGACDPRQRHARNPRPLARGRLLSAALAHDGTAHRQPRAAGWCEARRNRHRRHEGGAERARPSSAGTTAPIWRSRRGSSRSRRRRCCRSSSPISTASPCSPTGSVTVLPPEWEKKIGLTADAQIEASLTEGKGYAICDTNPNSDCQHGHRAFRRDRVCGIELALRSRR